MPGFSAQGLVRHLRIGTASNSKSDDSHANSNDINSKGSLTLRVGYYGHYGVLYRNYSGMLLLTTQTTTVTLDIRPTHSSMLPALALRTLFSLRDSGLSG